MKKVIVITGGNKGIGYGLAEGLCKKQNHALKHIILTSRNSELGLTALNNLKSQYSTANIEYHPLDLEDNESIKTFNKYVSSTHKRVDMLFNNAGYYDKKVAKDTASREKDAIKTFNVNVWGLVSLTEGLLDLGQFHQNAQIVNLTGEVGRLAFTGKKALNEYLCSRFLAEDLTLDELKALYNDYLTAVKEGRIKENGWEDNKIFFSYSVSKMFVNAYTRVLARRLADKKIKVNCVSPGWVKTDLGGPRAPRTLEQGCDTPMWMEEFPEEFDENLTGKFYQDKKELSFL